MKRHLAGLALGATGIFCGFAMASPRAQKEPRVGAGQAALATNAPSSGADAWLSLPGTPEGCSIQVPRNPERDIDPVEWMPCRDGRHGCQEMKADWRTDGNRDTFGGWNEASRDAAHRARRLRFERKRSPGVFEDVVLDLKSGTTTAAWRYDLRSQCAVVVSLGENTISTLGRWGNHNTLAVVDPAAWSRALTTPTFTALGGEASSAITSAVVSSDRTIALELGALRRVARAASGSGAFIASTPASVQVSSPLVLGDNVFVASEHGSDGWAQEYRLDPDGTLVLLRGRKGRHIAAMATDGATWFWTESFGGDAGSWWQPSLEIWSAPYTADPSELAATAHKIADASREANQYLPTRAIAFEGRYAFQTENTSVRVVRAQDGVLHSISPGAHRNIRAPLLIHDDELWVLAMQEPSGATQSAIERISLRE